MIHSTSALLKFSEKNKEVITFTHQLHEKQAFERYALPHCMSRQTALLNISAVNGTTGISALASKH